MAWQCYLIDEVAHILGVSNTVADALSRLYAPLPKRLPEQLTEVPRCKLQSLEKNTAQMKRTSSASLGIFRVPKRA
eukprot:3151877-Amphidinium_carterae.3